jgi:hypothetical protein
MRKTGLFFICVAAIVLLSSLIHAQKGQAPFRSRALFTSGQAPGMEVKVLKSVNGEWTLVNPATEKFKECDQFRVNFRSNVAGHVYFVNIDPEGKTSVIHREAVDGSSYKVMPGGTPDQYRNRYTRKCEGKMPPGGDRTARDNFIFFDHVVGIEILRLVLSPKRIPALDEALDAKPETPDAPGNPADLGCRALNIKCRSLGFGPPDVKKGNGAIYIAMPDKKTGIAQALGENEALTFEVRLNHVKR